MELQLVILGTGEERYHILLEKMQKKFPKSICVQLKFDDALAHKIYAGSDIFLMPSKYEPCGLGQMISLRYGTLPLVFKTGGLADTVNKENGYVFDKYDSQELIRSVKEAVKDFGNKDKWDDKVKKAMGYNFSWEESAKKYVSLYEQAKKK